MTLIRVTLAVLLGAMASIAVAQAPPPGAPVTPYVDPARAYANCVWFRNGAI